MKSLDQLIIELDGVPRGIRRWWLRLQKRWYERNIPRWPL